MLKKFTAYFLVAFLIISMGSLVLALDLDDVEPSEPAPVVSEFSGKGTEESPYIISEPEHLIKLADLVNVGNELYNSAYYELQNSIDFKGYDFTPIGRIVTEIVAETGSDGNVKTDSSGNIKYTEVETEKFPFSGHFNGNGYALKNISINSDERVVGVFGIGHNATVENLRVENISITATRNNTIHVGALFGRYEGNWRSEDLYVTKCHVDGELVVRSDKAAYTGGLIGVFEVTLNVATVSDCRVDIDIDSVSGTTSYVGGMFATIEKGIDLSRCVVTGRAYGEALGDANPYTGGVSARLVYDDWIGRMASDDSYLMATSGYSKAYKIVSSIQIESVGLYRPLIGNTFTKVMEATAANCYYDSKYKVNGTLDSFEGIGKTTEELFDKSFLQNTIGLDFVNTWEMVLGKPELIKKDSQDIAYDLNDTELTVQPVDCGDAKVIVAIINNGRFITAKMADYSAGLPVTFALGGLNYDNIKIFAVDDFFSPLCEFVELN